MTAQFSERLIYQGKEMGMQTTPLSDFLAYPSGRPEFREHSTACWRRYIGKWEISLDRLYLVEIHAHWVDGTKVELDQLFPGYPDRVFAHWYTGKIRCGQGKLLKYVHGGYASIYEMDLFITVKNGVVTNTRLKMNTVPEDEVNR